MYLETKRKERYLSIIIDGVGQTTYRDLLGAMPKAEANNWSPSFRKITTICENRVQLLFYHSLIIESVLSLTYN